MARLVLDVRTYKNCHAVGIPDITAVSVTVKSSAKHLTRWRNLASEIFERM